MCGIVGYIGEKQAAEIILEGLTRLEYRGYDSAGIAVLKNGHIETARAQGKLFHLKELLEKTPLSGTLGIGHTRWATHGKPSESNAHPHRAGSITLVHNGIIENYLPLRNELKAQGCQFSSDTDTEILAHLIHQEVEQGKSSLVALKNSLQKIKGSYALLVLNEREKDHLVATRFQSPLVIGVGENENFVASDVPALLRYTRKVIFLEDGDVAQIGRKEIQIWDGEGKKVQRPIEQIDWNLSQAEKGGYPHFMLKEIFEGPQAFIDTFRGRVDPSSGEIFLDGAEKIFDSQRNFNKIYLVACGTSYHAALLGKFFFEAFTQIPVIVDVASEFRYRNPVLDAQTLLITVSQSGETADTLVCVKNAKSQKAFIYSICNVLGSSIPRESDAVFYTHAGPEIGVAATKTLITQIEALFLIALCLGRSLNKLSREELLPFTQELALIPHKMKEVLKQREQIYQTVLKYQRAPYFLFIGRGFQYPIALEGALKLKEISYINSEGYAAGELKHGPIAMIDRGTPVVALAPRDSYYEKTNSNIEEVLSRDASLIAIGSQGDKELAQKAEAIFFVPKTHPLLYPLLTLIPLQLFAYELAHFHGHDVDQPRNLAKSVTVE